MWNGDGERGISLVDQYVDDRMYRNMLCRDGVSPRLIYQFLERMPDNDMKRLLMAYY